MSAASNKRHALFRSQGMCGRCGIVPSSAFHCSVCRDIRAKQAKAQREREKVNAARQLERLKQGDRAGQLIIQAAISRMRGAP